MYLSYISVRVCLIAFGPLAGQGMSCHGPCSTCQALPNATTTYFDEVHGPCKSSNATVIIHTARCYDTPKRGARYDGIAGDCWSFE